MFKDGMSKFVCTHKLIWKVLKISSIPILYIQNQYLSLVKVQANKELQYHITEVLQEYLG